MAVAEKPDLDEALLIHYGIKGMKWGLRKSKSVTGMNRRRSALVDRNDRFISRAENASRGKGLVRDRVNQTVNRLVLGKKLSGKIMNYRLDKRKAQNARLKRGEVTVRDRLTSNLRVTPIDMVLSNRPK